MSTQVDGPAGGRTGIRVSSLIYRLLWFLGLLVTAYSFVRLQRENQLGLSGWLTFLLGFAATIILVLVYLDIEAVENLGGSDHDYVGWVGVGNKKELTLRVLIVVSLLFAVGELHVVQQIFWWIVSRIQRIVGFKDCSLGSAVLGFFKGSDAFVSGSCGTFVFIASWNVGAIWHYCRRFKSKTAELKTNSRALVHHLILPARIGLFIVLATFCSAYWFCVWLASAAVDTLVHVLVVVFCVCVGLVFPLRIKGSRSWLELKIAAALEWSRTANTKNV